MKQITSPAFFIGKSQEGLISFGSGQPDLAPHDLCFQPLKEFSGFKYGPVQGEIKLRESIARMYPDAKEENIIITNGASEAIDLILRALYKKGGKVLLPRPYYYSYPENVRYAGMDSKFYDLDEKGQINLENFKEQIKDCHILMINSPSNPQGTILSLESLKEIEKITQELGIHIISDEVYKNIIYDRENYLIKGDNVVTVNSFSKTFSMCGLRVGYIYAREKELIEKIVEIKTHTSMNTSIVAQEMALSATLVPKYELDEAVKIWRKRRDLIVSGMKELGLDVIEPNGAFYVLPKMKNSNKVVNDLYYKYNVITYDGAWFGAPGHVRFSYALTEEKIKEGLKRLKKYLETEYKEN